MASIYKATNIKTGEVIEDSANIIADKLCVMPGNVYESAVRGGRILLEWKVEKVGKVVYIKICKVCGVKFNSEQKNALYCCKKCKIQAEAMREQGRKIEKKKAPKKKNQDLVDFNTEARQVGNTTYGKYEAEKWAKENVKIVRKW